MSFFAWSVQLCFNYVWGNIWVKGAYVILRWINIFVCFSIQLTSRLIFAVSQQKQCVHYWTNSYTEIFQATAPNESGCKLRVTTQFINGGGIWQNNLHIKWKGRGLNDVVLRGALLLFLTFTYSRSFENNRYTFSTQQDQGLHKVAFLKTLKILKITIFKSYAILHSEILLYMLNCLSIYAL